MTAPCRDYDPNFKLYGCELGAGHDGPHRDFRGHEWDEHLPAEPGRCGSYAPWGSGYPDQRCVLDIGHAGKHRDRSGNEWAEATEQEGRLTAAAAVPLADRIAGLARWVEERLDDEEYDRQAVAESALVQLQELAALARGGQS